MCLELTAKIVADEEGTVGRKACRRNPVSCRQASGLTAFEFQLVPGGCCCTMSGLKDAKADATFVKLDDAALPGLERALKLLGNRAGRFSFSAVWLLDPDEHLPAVQTSLKELLRRVRDNHIENGREYVVGRPA